MLNSEKKPAVSGICISFKMSQWHHMKICQIKAHINSLMWTMMKPLISINPVIIKLGLQANFIVLYLLLAYNTSHSTVENLAKHSWLILFHSTKQDTSNNLIFMFSCCKLFQLKFENSNMFFIYLVCQDSLGCILIIRSCYHQCLHAFNFRYDQDKW